MQASPTPHGSSKCVHQNVNKTGETESINAGYAFLSRKKEIGGGYLLYPGDWGVI